MALSRSHRRPHPVALFLLAISLVSDAARSEQDETQKPLSADNAKHFPALPVLGYVTPWHPRGKQLVEAHRHKFDIVSPVWYTVHAAGDGYDVRGGPPAPADEAWYQRLQRPAPVGGAAGAGELPPLQVAPRFLLDGWGAAEYRQLALNATRWGAFAAAVLAVVAARGYDGVVLEAGAAHALAAAVGGLSAALRARGRVLVVVVRPLRHVVAGGAPAAADEDAHAAAADRMVLQALPALALVADYFSVMTYDMTGPGGRRARHPTRENKRMAEAAAAGHDLREPRPNTSADWIRENLIRFVEATDPQTADQEQSVVDLEALASASRKFLLGVPLYGYKYPIVWADEAEGTVTEPKPTAIPHEPATKAAAAAPNSRPTVPRNARPILRDMGEPITATEIADLVKKHQPDIFRWEPDGEYYFDYQPAEDGGSWTRVFMPKSESITHVLNTVQDVVEDDLLYSFGGAGVALWEVGQSTDELLDAL